MLEFLNPARRGPARPLVNVTAVDQFWQLLPRDDPVAAQRLVSDALSETIARNRLGRGEFRALLALDQLARSLGDALLVDHPAGGAPSPKPDSWPSAHALCRSFGQAFELALRHLLEDGASRGWGEHVPTVLLRLFQHRQLEFLLRPYTIEHSIPDCWIGLHAAYRYAESAGALSQPLVVRRSHDGCGEETTLELEYIHVLLMQLLNDGRLSPFEAFWMDRQIPRWCAALSLQSDDAPPDDERADGRFVIDLDSTAGLVRPSYPGAGAHRYLDPAPLLARVRSEIAALSDPARPADRSSSFRRGRQLKLLRTISAICLPKPAPVNRRGERLPVAATVEAIVGLSRITRVLRREERMQSTLHASASPDGHDRVDPACAERAAASPSDPNPDGGQRPETTGAGFDGPDQVWQIKDRSASGCRLRGRITSSNRVLPGALVAMREHDSMPWTLAVVRRLRKRIGDRVDIGVEYLGVNPSVVGLAADGDDAANLPALPARKRRQCAALYLRESSGHPRLPFRTLILPPRQFAVGRCLSLRSNGNRHTVRLKEPIEEQDSFVWLSYEAVYRPLTVGRAQVQPHDDKPAIGLPPSRTPLPARAAEIPASALPEAS